MEGIFSITRTDGLASILKLDLGEEPLDQAQVAQRLQQGLDLANAHWARRRVPIAAQRVDAIAPGDTVAVQRKARFALPRSDGMVSVTQIAYRVPAFPFSVEQDPIEAEDAEAAAVDKAMNDCLAEVLAQKNAQWKQGYERRTARGESCQLIQALSAHRIADQDVPTDRTFRDGWTFQGGKFGHDMARCREIDRRHRRAARVPLLTALDIDYLRADEDGDTQRKAEIAARKRQLRDITAEAAIERAATPEELKAAWPQLLGKRPV